MSCALTCEYALASSSFVKRWALPPSLVGEQFGPGSRSEYGSWLLTLKIRGVTCIDDERLSKSSTLAPGKLPSRGRIDRREVF